MTRLLVVFLGLVGVVVGVFGLLFTPLYAGAVPVPLGIVVSALTLPWLVRAAGELDPRPSAASAPLLGWLVAVFGLGLFGPGGDRMLPPTWQSMLLVFVGIGASLWALRSVIMDEAARAELERQRPAGPDQHLPDQHLPEQRRSGRPRQQDPEHDQAGGTR